MMVPTEAATMVDVLIEVDILIALPAAPIGNRGLELG